VSGSASRDKDGKIHISLTNLDPNRSWTVNGEVSGAHVSRASGRMLTAAAMNARNTFDQPTAVQPAPFTGVRISGDRITLDLPPKSVVVVELQ